MSNSVTTALVILNFVSVVIPSPVQQTTQINTDEINQLEALHRAKLVAQRFNNALQKKANSTSAQVQGTSLQNGKKAAILLQRNSTGVLPFNDIRDIIPIVLDNVITPLIQRVLIRENAFTLFGGWTSKTTDAPSVAVQESVDESTRSAPSKPKPPKKVIVTSTTTGGNSGRDLNDETTTLASKTKYKVRVRNRTKRTTQKPVDKEDDEDESGLLDKLKNLRKS